MIYLFIDKLDKGWSDWIFNQFGVAIAAIAVSIMLYKMYDRTLKGKDEVVAKERDRLIKEIDQLKSERNTLQQELRELAVDSIKAFSDTSKLIESVILNRLTQDTTKLKEMINMMQSNFSNHLSKIELLLSNKSKNA